MTPRLGTPSHGQHCKIIPSSSITVRNIKHSADILDTSVVIKHFAYNVGSNHVVCKTVIYRRHHLQVFSLFPDVKNVVLVTVFLKCKLFPTDTNPVPAIKVEVYVHSHKI
jgi:hypothetical protein